VHLVGLSTQEDFPTTGFKLRNKWGRWRKAQVSIRSTALQLPSTGIIQQQQLHS
jgi:hypothetical protein